MTRSIFKPTQPEALPFDPEAMAAAREFLSFLAKNRHRDFIPQMRKLVKKHAHVASDFVWLHAHEMRQTEEEWAIMALFALLQLPDFTPSQRRRSKQAAAAAIERVMTDRGIADAVKASFLPILNLIGQPVDNDAVRQYFHDFDDAMLKANQKVAREVSDTPEALIKLLEIHRFEPKHPDHDQSSLTENAITLFHFGRDVARINPAGSVIMGLALAQGAEDPEFSHEQALGALDLIREANMPRARWCLEALAQWPGFAVPFRKRAAALAADLAAAGLKSQPPPVPGELSHCLVSMCDGSGSRTCVVFRRNPAGELDAFNILLSDETGVKDAFAVFGDGSLVENSLRRDAETFSIATVPAAYVRDLLADALALHEERGTPPPGKLFALLPALSEQHITPKRRVPNLGAYMLETHRLTPALALADDHLARQARFGCLRPSSDAAYAFCRDHMRKRGHSLAADAFETFLREIMPLEQEQLLRRLAINLEVEVMAGRASNPDNQAAARLWLGLGEKVLPLEKIPFIRKIAAVGVSEIIDNLRKGFMNEREALAQPTPWEEETDLPDLFSFLEAFAPKKSRRLFKDMMESFADAIDIDDAPANPRRKLRRVYRLSARPVPPASERDSAPNAADGRSAANEHCATDEQGESNGRCTVEIAGNQSLSKLDEVLDKIFPRGDAAGEYRLSETRRFALPPSGSATGKPGAAATTLDALDLAAGQTFLRLTGDSGERRLEITVLAIGQALPRQKYPRLIV